MSGNGVGTGTIVITIKIVPVVTPAVLVRALTGFGGAAPGATGQPACVVPIAASIARAMAATA